MPTRRGGLSRRKVLGAAVAVGGAVALSSRWGEALAAPLKLISKPIPSTHERIPAMGLGTIWYRDAQAEDLRALIARMVELGGRVIDTAAAYGESEGVIGKAIAQLGVRSKLFLASKFDAGGSAMPGPPATGPAPGMPPSAPGAAPIPGPPAGVARPERDGVGGAASFERSLQRLQTNYLDLLQVHGLNGTDSLMPLLAQWKKDKRIRYLGVTTSNPQQHDELIETMRRYPLDFIQVDYSIGNRGAAQSVFPVAAERRVAVLANLPLGRATLLDQVANRPLPSWAAAIDVSSWAQFLLKYVISHPAVTCAIPGSLHLNHLEDNQAAGRGRLPDAAMRQRMEALWDSLSG